MYHVAYRPAAARSAIANRRQRQRALDELMALDDRSLADIGIHRSQIPNLAMRFEQAAQIDAAPFAGPTGAPAAACRWSPLIAALEISACPSTLSGDHPR
jgi:uncharacterized protein YjiS (DUF1127 family)